MLFIFLGVFVLFMLLGVPVAFAMGGTALVCSVVLWGVSGVPLPILTQQVVAGVNSFTTLAIPLFLFAGKLMNSGGITDRIFNFCQKLVGHLPGGLGHVNVLASVIFSGMSGTAAADAGGLGSMEIKAMEDQGFDTGFSVAVTGASSLIGPIIPPSVPMVTYGVLSGTSVSALFIGGILPGLLMAASMSALVVFYSIRRNYPRCARATFQELLHEFGRAFLPLLTPVIIIGGIWTGVFTPTEAAGVATTYAFFIIVFVYQEMRVKEVWFMAKETVVDCVAVLSIVAFVTVYGYVLTRTRIPQILAEAVFEFTSDPTLIVLLLVAFLLIVGCFMSTMESILLFTPIFYPLLNEAGVNLLVFGVIMCLVLMVGQLTPPFGIVLFVLTKISGMEMMEVVKHSLPFTLPVLLVVALIILFPGIVTFLPSLMIV